MANSHVLKHETLAKGHSTSQEIPFKLVLLGETSVGKSCLVVRFSQNEFHSLREPTIGAAFVSQTLHLDHKSVKFEIWDTAGQERYRSLASMYYRGSAGAIVVYDITDIQSFHQAKAWVQQIMGQDPKGVIVALAGNKVDLNADRVISTEEAKQYADSLNLIFMETSAKTGENVLALFTEIARKMPEQKERTHLHQGFPLKLTPTPQSTSWCNCI